MRKSVLPLLLILITLSSFAQNEKVSVFNRMLIFNESDELMVIKIKGTDFWLTPGFYQTESQSIKQGLDSIAASYGMKLGETQLRGVFSLKRFVSGGNYTSVRNVFKLSIAEYKPKVPPADIEDIQWLPLEMALDKISFPHINEMIKKVMEAPEQVWAGTLTQHRDPVTGEWATKVIEPFYPM